ncbi:hypothetical protein Tco_1093196 [Tanacetum coccineum]|uniref:Uncharacterized protein n=1 Tax=Tanacetum coccineum TaxID=301880 RepID=A0ABQ5IC46_9ASTR
MSGKYGTSNAGAESVGFGSNKVYKEGGEMKRRCLSRSHDFNPEEKMCLDRPEWYAIGIMGLQRFYKKLGWSGGECSVFTDNVSYRNRTYRIIATRLHIGRPIIESMRSFQSNPLEMKDAEGPILDESLENRAFGCRCCDQIPLKNVNMIPCRLLAIFSVMKSVFYNDGGELRMHGKEFEEDAWATLKNLFFFIMPYRDKQRMPVRSLFGFIEYAGATWGKSFLDTFDDQKCMKKVVPSSRSKATEDIISIGSFVKVLGLNQYVLVRGEAIKDNMANENVPSSFTATTETTSTLPPPPPPPQQSTVHRDIW